MLNRLLREAFAANPPPLVSNQRLKLFYATQPRSAEQTLSTPEFVLFVNDPQLLGETYARYLEARIRERIHFRFAAHAELPSEKRDGAAERTSLGWGTGQPGKTTRRLGKITASSVAAKNRSTPLRFARDDGRQRR